MSCSDDGDDSTGDDDGDEDDDASGDGAPAHKRRRGGRSPGGSPGSDNGAAIHPLEDDDDDAEGVVDEVSDGENDVDDDDVDGDGDGEGDDDNLGAVVPAQQQPDTFDKVVEGNGKPKWVCKLCPPDAKRRSKSAADHRKHWRQTPQRTPSSS